MELKDLAMNSYTMHKHGGEGVDGGGGAPSSKKQVTTQKLKTKYLTVGPHLFLELTAFELTVGFEAAIMQYAVGIQMMNIQLTERSGSQTFNFLVFQWFGIQTTI